MTPRPFLLVLAVAALAWACGKTDANGPATDTQATEATPDAVEAVAEATAEATALEPAPETTAEESAPEVATPPTPAELAALVTPQDYSTDLALIALPREPGSTHWQEVQDLCADRFQALGYTVERQAYGTGGVGVNVIGVLPGTSRASERVLVSAHYDGVPDCPAADDNGSGVAGVLRAAAALAHGSFARTLVVACWDQEEDGLVGSTAYAARVVANSESIVAAYVFEMIGFTSDEPASQTLPSGFEYLFPAQAKQVADNDNRGDFLAVIGDQPTHESMAAMQAYGDGAGLPVIVIDLTEALKKSPLLHDLQRSDHGAFWAIGVPAMMITDTSEFRNAHYHCYDGQDSIDTLDTGFAVGVIRATVASAATLLGSAP